MSLDSHTDTYEPDTPPNLARIDELRGEIEAVDESLLAHLAQLHSYRNEMKVLEARLSPLRARNAAALGVPLPLVEGLFALLAKESVEEVPEPSTTEIRQKMIEDASFSLIALLAQRLNCINRIGAVKAVLGLSVCDSTREAELKSLHARTAVPLNLPLPLVETVFTLILEDSKACQRRSR
ncbi:MAG: chorismate mutase [Candidatus Gracilibacteria bacterium]|jgi:chorismate mutase